MLDAILEIVKLALKMTAFAIPLMIVVMIVTLGSGELEYQTLKKDFKAIYETATDVVTTFNQENMEKIVNTFSKGLWDSDGDGEYDGGDLGQYTKGLFWQFVDYLLSLDDLFLKKDTDTNSLPYQLRCVP